MKTDDKRQQTSRLNAVTHAAYVSPSAIYALAVVALQEHGHALNQISRQGRRLLSQYEKLTQQLLAMRQLFPPVAPEAPDFEPQNERVETKLT